MSEYVDEYTEDEAEVAEPKKRGRKADPGLAAYRAYAKAKSKADKARAAYEKVEATYAKLQSIAKELEAEQAAEAQAYAELQEVLGSTSVSTED